MREILTALDRIKSQTLLLWPNIDAGSDNISKTIRIFRDENKPDWLRNQTNFSPDDYLEVLANTACAVGNSSSFVRDAGYFGTPVVLVGDRQDGRECDRHVVKVPPIASQIEEAVKKQLKNGGYAPSSLYGDGYVSERIVRALARIQLYTQKRLHYPEVDES